MFLTLKANETMVGFKKAEAGSEMTLAKKKKSAKVAKPLASVDQEEMEEEWGGIEQVA